MVRDLVPGGVGAGGLGGVGSSGGGGGWVEMISSHQIDVVHVQHAAVRPGEQARLEDGHAGAHGLLHVDLVSSSG